MPDKEATIARPTRLTRSERLDYMKSIAGGLPVFLIVRGPKTPQEADDPRIIWGTTLAGLGRMADHKLQMFPQPKPQAAVTKKPISAITHWAIFCSVMALIAAGLAALNLLLTTVMR